MAEQKLLGALLGFLVGSIALVALYLLFQISMEIFDVHRARVRIPVAILVLPFLLALYGYKLGPEIIATVQEKIQVSSAMTRLLIVGPLFWAAVVLAYTFTFEPFGYSISEREWWLVGKIVLFPALVFWCGFWVFTKVVFKK